MENKVKKKQKKIDYVTGKIKPGLTAPKPSDYVFGRPSTYEHKHCQMVIDAMSTGLTKNSSAALLGISIDTFDKWQKKHKDFYEAVAIGVSMSSLFWEQVGIKGSVGEYKKFSSAAWIFNMKNRHGWKDKSDMEINAENQTTVINIIRAEKA